jgi:hypothetical protein
MIDNTGAATGAVQSTEAQDVPSPMKLSPEPSHSKEMTS